MLKRFQRKLRPTDKGCRCGRCIEVRSSMRGFQNQPDRKTVYNMPARRNIPRSCQLGIASRCRRRGNSRVSGGPPRSANCRDIIPFNCLLLQNRTQPRDDQPSLLRKNFSTVLYYSSRCITRLNFNILHEKFCSMLLYGI
ncbi:hypothetical protein PUN28_008821 [Cardiocondyla obscurior]|uniref:Uncharacterized protein n=1 Tax=Cardiocondyla obscurior TaxID=286306 RepID=A0AAW2FPI9_9HYME